MTPGRITIAARVALAAALLAGGGALALDLGGWPVVLATGYATGFLGLLGFPRVRRGDVVSGALAVAALVGCVAGSGPALSGHVAAALAGCLAAVLPLWMMAVRLRAAANPHMPFSEWRRLDQRDRRRTGDLRRLPVPEERPRQVGE